MGASDIDKISADDKIASPESGEAILNEQHQGNPIGDHITKTGEQISSIVSADTPLSLRDFIVMQNNFYIFFLPNSIGYDNFLQNNFLQNSFLTKYIEAHPAQFLKLCEKVSTPSLKSKLGKISIGQLTLDQVSKDKKLMLFLEDLHEAYECMRSYGGTNRELLGFTPKK